MSGRSRLALLATMAFVIVGGGAEAEKAGWPNGAPSQTAPGSPDPVLCRSLMAAMASAPTEDQGWTRSPALEYAGGRVQCFAVETISAFDPAPHVRCTFSTRELAGPASCPRGLPFSADYVAEMRPRDEYMRTRAMATLAACFPGVTPTPYQAELGARTSHDGQSHPPRMVSGRQYAPPGQAPVRLVASTETEERNGGRCIYQSAEFQIGLKPSAR